MLIFYEFPNRKKAQEFIEAVKEIFPKQEGIICKSHDASDKIDPFPFKLTPPIVLLLRDEMLHEVAMEAIAPWFGGRCAGT